MLLPDAVHLRLTLGEVDGLADAAVPGGSGQLLQVIRHAAVGGVGAVQKLQAGLILEQLHLINGLAVFHVGFVRFRKAGKPAGDDGAESGIVYCPGGGGLRSACAAAQHLDDREQGGPVDVLLGHVVLDPLHGVQPVEEGEVVGDVAVDGHIGVGVGVDKPGHHQLSARVKDTVGVLAGACRDGRNAAAVNQNVLLLDFPSGPVPQQDKPVLNQCFHDSSIRPFSACCHCAERKAIPRTELSAPRR